MRAWFRRKLKILLLAGLNMFEKLRQRHSVVPRRVIFMKLNTNRRKRAYPFEHRVIIIILFQPE